MINTFIFRKILLNCERQNKAFYKVFKVCFGYNKLRHTNRSYSIAEDLVLTDKIYKLCRSERNSFNCVKQVYRLNTDIIFNVPVDIVREIELTFSFFNVVLFILISCSISYSGIVLKQIESILYFMSLLSYCFFLKKTIIYSRKNNIFLFLKNSVISYLFLIISLIPSLLFFAGVSDIIFLISSIYKQVISYHDLILSFCFFIFISMCYTIELVELFKLYKKYNYLYDNKI